MIDALITGRLIHCKEADNLVIGRIVLGNDKPVQFTAKRGRVKTALLAMPGGMPVAVSGQLSSSVKFDKDGKPFVLHEILISAVLTAQPPRSLLASIL